MLSATRLPSVTGKPRLPGRLEHLAFWRPALRTLCYHRVAPVSADALTVTLDQFETQIAHLIAADFRFVTVQDVIDGATLPARAVLITFDDGYVDTLEHAAPILKSYGASAAVFVVTAHVGDRARWDQGGADLMGRDELAELQSGGFELCLHSHRHRSFTGMTTDEISEDLRQSLAAFDEFGLRVTPALAYPYGARPRHAMLDVSRVLTSLGIEVAFRLGNRLTRTPTSHRHEIQQLVITPNITAGDFGRKLSTGRLF